MPRPKVGLVLSGGGARGLAHVGVLKVLERERIPVDLVVGTSMGAIIGGLYASGMRATDIERELLAVRWDEVFAARVSRPQLSQRRKEQDFEMSAAIELGIRDGEFRLPQAAVSSRGLESMLRRFTLPVRDVQRFDALPIPFRAVATDMESGALVELEDGDLALALRSSMSVPGVFAPIERSGRLLGDGGLVNNLPVDIARRLGADIVIAVNVGTPVAGRESLGSAVGLTAQMINILTEQNVQRSIASLGPRDLLIKPVLGRLSSGDFARTAELIGLGEAAAEQARAQWAGLALAAPGQPQWGARRERPTVAPVVLASVGFEGSTATRPQRFEAQLESRAGQPFDPDKAERDARLLAASGDYVRSDYHLTRTPAGEGLVFYLEDKPWGPNYLRIGLDLSTDFAGRSAFNLKLAHDRRWLTDSGSEWRNRLNLGQAPLIASEWYHPLQWSDSLEKDWFLSAWGLAERRIVPLFTADGDEVASFDRLLGRVGIDLGQPWARWGEVRLGLVQERLRIRPRLLDDRYAGSRATTVSTETGLRLHTVIDQLDYALFPQSGYRIQADAAAGRRRGVDGGLDSGPFHRLQGQATFVHSIGRHSLNVHLSASLSDEGSSPLVGRYSLGGFHNLSGYESGQLSGNHLLFGRLTWYVRLNREVVLTRGFFMGVSVEAGNTWLRSSQVSLADLRTGGSLFLGADTGVGPMYLAVTSAPGGSTGIAFFIGRP